MQMNQPIGDPTYGPLFVRLPLGAYFALAGWSKLQQLAGFIIEVKKMGVLPDNLASLYGTCLPYVEVAIGVFIFLGMWTTLASMLSTFMLFTFVLAFGLFPGDNPLFNKDVILLGASISLLFTGSGAFGVDNLKRP